MTDEDTADWEYSVCAVVNCRMYELVVALYLIEIMRFKSSVNNNYQSEPCV
jgi:hypothetical protein